MRINTNVASLQAQASATETNSTQTSSLEKLSSGLAINKASDDASGLSIADKLRTQASSLGQGISNANSASALITIADKGMSEQSDILDTVKTKLIQASTSTTSEEGRESIRKDISKLLEQFDNISSQTNYNGTNLLNEKGAEFSFQVGEDSSFDIGLKTEYAVNTKGLGAGEELLNQEDSLVNYSDGIAIAGQDTQVSVQYDTDSAVTGNNQKSILIGGSTTTNTDNGFIAVDIAGENVNGLGLATGGGSGADTVTLSTTDSALMAELDKASSATGAPITKVDEGVYEVANSEDFVIKFDDAIDITNLSISGLETGNTVGDVVQVISDELVSVTKTDGSASVKLDVATYAGTATTTAAPTANIDLVGLASNSADGIQFDGAAGNGVTIEEGTVGVKFDSVNNPTAQTAQAAVKIETAATAAGATDESKYTINAQSVDKMIMDLTAAGTSSVTLTSGNSETMAKLDELAKNNSALTKLNEGAYTFETTLTAAGKAVLDFDGAELKDLSVSGQDKTEDITLITEEAVFVTKEDSSDAEDVKLTAQTINGSGGAGYAATNIAAGLVGANSDVIQTSESLAGLTTLGKNELTADVANKFMAVVDNAMTQLNSVRSDFGSTQNQLEVASRNMLTTQVNIQAAESIIRDVDYAAESASFNKQNIIAQAGTYAMTQSNSLQQNITKLLQ